MDTNIYMFQTQKLWQDSKNLAIECNKITRIFSDSLAKEYGKEIRNKCLKLLSNISMFYSFDSENRKDYLKNSKELIIDIQNILIICNESKYLSTTLYNHLILYLSNLLVRLEENLKLLNS